MTDAMAMNDTDELSETLTLSNASLVNYLVNETQQNAEDEFQFYQFYKTEQLTFLWILFIMIVFGNCSVLITLLMSKNRKTRMNFFIMHLAIADLMVGLINVLTDIAWRTTVGFYAGNIACKVVKFLQVLVTYSSTYVLVSLTIDRYDAITHPLNFSGSWRRAKILVLGAWGLSAIFSVPAIFLNEETMVRGHPQCWINLEPWQWQVYITLVALSLFFLPAVIISACYIIIVHTIWTKSRLKGFPPTKYRSNGSRASKGSTMTSFSTGATTLNDTADGATTSLANTSVKTITHDSDDCKRASSRGVIPRAKIKTVKMTFVIVFVFILCWSPYFVWDLLQVYGFIPLSQTTIAVSTFIQSLAPLNSAANPIIYCLFSTHICRNIRFRPFRFR
ncbi:Cardioacceleratory peptide receptor [Halotydeus destructor]|nr:Cardioacceleratory peptide receptor [Halotydeus destructor]